MKSAFELTRVVQVALVINESEGMFVLSSSDWIGFHEAGDMGSLVGIQIEIVPMRSRINSHWNPNTLPKDKVGELKITLFDYFQIKFSYASEIIINGLKEEGVSFLYHPNQIL